MPEHLDAAHEHGEVFLDTRGDDRALRLRWHRDAGLVVLSLWRDGMCVGTFRLARADVDDFVDALVDGLRDEPGSRLPRQRSGGLVATGNISSSSTTADDEDPLAEKPAFVDWAFGQTAAS
ncbi:MAG: hypothetical protein ACR2KG_12965 [Nocardioidaceae bacterium]